MGSPLARHCPARPLAAAGITKCVSMDRLPLVDLRLAVASIFQREARQRRSPGAHQDAAHVAPERCHVRQRCERHVELDYHEFVRADSLVLVAVRRCLVKLIVAWPGSPLLRVRGRRQIVSSFCSPLVAPLRLLMVNPRVLNRIWLALPASSSCVIVAHRPQPACVAVAIGRKLDHRLS